MAFPSPRPSLTAFWSVPSDLYPVCVAFFLPWGLEASLCSNVITSGRVSPECPFPTHLTALPQSLSVLRASSVSYLKCPLASVSILVVSLPPEPKAILPLLDNNIEGPLYSVAGQTSVRSGLVILESSGEGEGSQDGKSWHVGKVCQLKFILLCLTSEGLVSSLRMPADSRPAASPEKNRTPSKKNPAVATPAYELSQCPWPAQDMFGGMQSFTDQIRAPCLTLPCTSEASHILVSCSGPLDILSQ